MTDDEIIASAHKYIDTHLCLSAITRRDASPDDGRGHTAARVSPGPSLLIWEKRRTCSNFAQLRGEATARSPCNKTARER